MRTREAKGVKFFNRILTRHLLDNKIQSHLSDLSSDLYYLRINHIFVDLKYIKIIINQDELNDLYMKYALVLDKVYLDLIHHKLRNLKQDSHLIKNSVPKLKYLV